MRTMKFSISIFALSLITLAVFTTAFPTLAVDVTYDGYFRTRGNYFYDLALNRDQSPATRAYTDMRFRLNPSFIITDKFRVKTSLNFMDGILGDNPFRSSSYNNPAASYDRTIDPSQTETKIGRPISDLSTSTYGGVYAPDGLIQSTALTPIRLRRAWAEFDLPYGTLKVGRMPFDLGMGIYATAGDGVDQEVGTTRDRIVFDTAFGPYYLRPGIGWLVEGALDQSADDFIEYFFQFGRKTDIQNISFYLGYNNQSNYRPDATVTTAIDPLVNRGTHYWSFDFYAQNQFEHVNLQTEVALFSGRVVGFDTLAINAAARADWNVKPLTLLTEVGFSSGTDAGDSANGDLKTVPFNRDYNVSLILFEEAIPGGKNTKNAAGAADTTPTAPHSGAISNALYARLRLGYDVSSFFQPAINILVPYAAKEPAGGSSKFYGIEYDLITDWPNSHYLTANLSFGHFIPGEFYDNFSSGKSHSALLIRGGVTAKF
ncbi:MAG: hypothetical protein JWQ35_392 [Bacteriovoracaceae bacterium]|nr:hypothetical protein [Bacteriovoracaceae bacterium]